MKVKIDVANIPNYESFTEEQKTALSAMEIDVPDPDYTGWVKKDVFDKKASEAAELSKQMKSRMTEAEAAQAAREEEALAMKTELETLRKEKTVSAYKAKYLELGYEAELASLTAEAMADGKTDVVFENQKKFLETQKKTIEAQALNQQPSITSGDVPTTKTAEEQQLAQMRKWAGL